MHFPPGRCHGPVKPANQASEQWLPSGAHTFGLGRGGRLARAVATSGCGGRGTACSRRNRPRSCGRSCVRSAMPVSASPARMTQGTPHQLAHRISIKAHWNSLVVAQQTARRWTKQCRCGEAECRRMEPLEENGECAKKRYAVKGPILDEAKNVLGDGQGESQGNSGDSGPASARRHSSAAARVGDCRDRFS